jgi:hypothetical protein
MDAINSKWGVPCPLGEACTHNRPDKCASAFQTSLAKERASTEFKGMLDKWRLPTPRGNDGVLGQGRTVDIDLVAKPDVRDEETEDETP